MMSVFKASHVSYVPVPLSVGRIDPDTKLPIRPT